MKKLIGRHSKLELAEALWPTLETKVVKTAESGNLSDIPVARVVRLALELADEFPRSGLVVRKK